MQLRLHRCALRHLYLQRHLVSLSRLRWSIALSMMESQGTGLGLLFDRREPYSIDNEADKGTPFVSLHTPGKSRLHSTARIAH